MVSIFIIYLLFTQDYYGQADFVPLGCLQIFVGSSEKKLLCCGTFFLLLGTGAVGKRTKRLRETLFKVPNALCARSTSWECKYPPPLSPAKV